MRPKIAIEPPITNNDDGSAFNSDDAYVIDAENAIIDNPIIPTANDAVFISLAILPLPM